MGTEQDLIARLRRGDREAQRELYEATSGRIYGVLLKITRNKDVALELAQETYLRAFTRFKDFTGRSSPEGWLYRIAVNEALQYLRRQKSEGEHMRALWHRRGRYSGEAAAALRLDVQAVLARLDPIDRTILVLRYQEGMDYRTIAQVLECEAGTVASRLNRARARLREKLADAYAPREEIRGDFHQRN